MIKKYLMTVLMGQVFGYYCEHYEERRTQRSSLLQQHTAVVQQFGTTSCSVRRSALWQLWADQHWLTEGTSTLLPLTQEKHLAEEPCPPEASVG